MEWETGVIIYVANGKTEDLSIINSKPSSPVVPIRKHVIMVDLCRRGNEGVGTVKSSCSNNNWNEDM